MKVDIQHLTKKYDNQIAVNDMSLSIEGEGIVGLLGPNGAGKSTTMKIITGVIGATSGSVEIDGNEISYRKNDFKNRIGYLPESNPLYKDMYVLEFLRFTSDIFRLPNKKSAISRVIEECGLTKEKNKKIGALSKGFKQRVGLAQAIIHNPDLLILDEPTSGLDANQLVEIRALIKRLSRDKLIIFSSHIMQEVEALCDRVVILDQGKVVADDSINLLQSKLKNEKIFEIEFEKVPDNKNIYKMHNNELSLSWTGKILYVQYGGKEDIRPHLFHCAVNNNDVIIRFQEQKKNFEHVFQKLTRKV